MAEEERVNPEKHPEFNREPGVVVVPGSNFAKYMESFEQFPSKYGSNPGNPYNYRDFPKMLYRAEEVNGKAVCMSAAPNPLEFKDQQEFHRAEEMARKFTERCQLKVNSREEQQKAMENGWREDPTEAVEYLRGRQKDVSTAAAERLHAEQRMSAKAKAESKAAMDEAGVHLGEIPETPILRRQPISEVKTTSVPAQPPKRRGRPPGSKNKKTTRKRQPKTPE